MSALLSSIPQLPVVRSGKFSVLTWNVWFDRFYFDNRVDDILRICGKQSPDVICLQEVTYPFFQLMTTSSPWLTDYEISPYSFIKAPYCTLTLCKKEHSPRFHRVSFPSHMGRDLLLTELVTANGQPLHIGNVHLESLAATSTREAQLKICYENLPATNSILCGDFNFCSYRNFVLDSSRPLENLVLSRTLGSPFQDLWTLLHNETEEPGYTYDTEVNGMLRSTGKYERMRYDRILCALASTTMMQPSTITLIGTDPLADSDTKSKAITQQNDPMVTPPAKSSCNPIIFPSDHFGLMADFELR